ncbi:MAG: YitT family protein [Lachnospiraceae bacterium]
MFKNYKRNLLKIIILMVGLTIAHLGVTLFLLTNLGSDPYNVLVQGVYRTLSNLTGWEFLTHGRVHIALCFLIILILLATDKTYIKIGTVLCMIFGGPIIDIFTLILKPVVTESSPLAYKLIILALGCVILAYGMTIVIKSDAGTGPNDLVAVVISDKTKQSFGIVRVITDISFVLAGFLLGGSVGLGTVICAACVGPVANIFLPINEKLIQKVYILFFPTAI